MDYKKFGNKYVIRIDRGDEVVDSLKRVCVENGVKLGTVSGIGAVNNVTVGLFDTTTKQYHKETFTGDHEITALVGNVSTMNGQVYFHLHATLSDITHQAIGGHLNQAVVSGTCECIIDAIDGEVDREFSDEIGLNLLKF